MVIRTKSWSARSYPERTGSFTCWDTWRPSTTGCYPCWASATVVADDSTFPSVAGYLAYVRDPAHGYVTVSFPVEDGMEISCWTGTG